MKTIEIALQEIRRIAEDSEENCSDSRNNQNGGDGKRCLFMIANEVPFVMAMAVDMFIKDITTRAWIHTDSNRRKTIHKSDIIHATSDTEMYDFLIDVIPRLTDVNNNNTNSTTTTATTTSAGTYALSNYTTAATGTPTPAMYTTSSFNTNGVPVAQQQQQQSGTDVRSEQPRRTPLMQPMGNEQQQQNVAINEFPESYSRILVSEPVHDSSHEAPLPSTPLTADMIFSPQHPASETQPTHLHLHDTPHPDHDDLQQGHHQQQQNSATNLYDSSSLPSQQWALE